MHLASAKCSKIVADTLNVKKFNMKVGLISDTHSYIDSRIEHHLSGCDEIWHAGDVGHPSVIDRLEAIAPVIGVHGNIDGTEVRSRFPEIIEMNHSGLKVLMVHIAGSIGRYNPGVRNAIRSFEPTVLVCGHSHLMKVMRDDQFNLLYMNPGAAGIHGFHKVRTLCRFEINDGKLLNLEVVELGLRSSQPVH